MKQFFVTGIVFLSTLFLNAQEIHKRTLKLMGSRFEITVVAEDETQANAYIGMAVAEISRIEKLISSWDPNSQTSEINRNAGVKPIMVSEELFALINRCQGLSKLTDGAFDITFASVDKIWKFDGSMTVMPSEEEITNSVQRIGFEKIVLNEAETSVYLPETGMKIGFGAIGKGYAADKAKALLQERGVKAGIINASGDMNTWGKQPSGDDWKVAITNPMDKNKAFALLPIYDSAVVTSGNYEKYVMIDGERYSHIIDPRTGYPAKGIVSATIFAPKAELADALATATFVMGIEAGIDRINQLPDIECILIDDTGAIHTSRNITLNTN
ncbi:FAD:protein FMN transferase [Luteirhabdus pelagi]|uniref:FAD:protein FMN transferase n=1 Tax=Luteirhabdus pelagi TaxID=2792783 RepID=UPI001F3AE61B|nr:FAD:protein FMN transferase [Luteirhabdus pelagi]